MGPRRAPGGRRAARAARAALAAAAAGAAALAVAWRAGAAAGCALLGAAGPAAAAGAGAAGDAPAAPCETVRAEVMQKVWPRLESWEKTSRQGRMIMGFGNKASKMLNRTLEVFDAEVEQLAGEEGGCSAERGEVEKLLTQQLHSIFLVQRSTIEQVLYQRLKQDLLRKMQRKRRELNVKEKLRLFSAAMHDYDSQVVDLRPFFVDNTERDRAEKRLSQLQWGIHETPEGKDMMQKWKMDRMRRMGMQRQSKDFSVSLSPGMRLMFRPFGLGNFQIYSRRTIGPPHNENEVAIGMLNDGKVVDVYNKAPRPPLIKFQPSVGVDVSTG